jgi:hypothetical protein
MNINRIESNRSIDRSIGRQHRIVIRLETYERWHSFSQQIQLNLSIQSLLLTNHWTCYMCFRRLFTYLHMRVFFRRSEKKTHSLPIKSIQSDCFDLSWLVQKCRDNKRNKKENLFFLCRSHLPPPPFASRHTLSLSLSLSLLHSVTSLVILVDGKVDEEGERKTQHQPRKALLIFIIIIEDTSNSLSVSTSNDEIKSLFLVLRTHFHFKYRRFSSSYTFENIVYSVIIVYLHAFAQVLCVYVSARTYCFSI